MRAARGAVRGLGRPPAASGLQALAEITGLNETTLFRVPPCVPPSATSASRRACAFARSTADFADGVGEVTRYAPMPIAPHAGKPASLTSRQTATRNVQLPPTAPSASHRGSPS